MLMVLAFLTGCITGMRTMMAPAFVAWAAYTGWIDLSRTVFAFFENRWIVGLVTAFALAELVADKLPVTPSRKVPMQFGARLLSGAICGSAIGGDGGGLIPALVVGVAGAVAGTYGGAAMRGYLARIFGWDLLAAVTEDVVAIIGMILIICAAPYAVALA